MELLYIIMCLIVVLDLLLGGVDLALKIRRNNLLVASKQGAESISEFISRKNLKFRDLHEQGAYLEVVRSVERSLSEAVNNPLARLIGEFKAIFIILTAVALLVGIVLFIVGEVLACFTMILISIGLLCLMFITRDIVHNSMLILSIMREFIRNHV